MGKLLQPFKSLLKNKNLVTIVCVSLGAMVLWYGYNYRIKNATNPIKVPYAVVDIEARMKIDESMIGMVDVPSSMLTSSAIRKSADVIGKYVNYNTMIPAGSLFYKSVLVDWTDMPDSAWADIKDGNTVVSLNVNVESTLGNSIRPGTIIDLYCKANDNGRLLFGKLIEKISVLAVKNSKGVNIFERTDVSEDEPAYLLFSVPEELHLLLRKALLLGNIEIIPVQRNANYTEENAQVSSEYIRDFILSQTVNLDYEEITE